jgi:Bax protein
MTRVSNTVTVCSVAALVPVALVMSLVVSSTAWPEPMPDFRAFEAGPDRKAVFFEYVEPLIAEANGHVAEDRERLTEIAGKSEFSWLDRWWLEKLAAAYRIENDSMDEEELLSMLLLRVDVVPTSLALAQAAKESGWGTSRFAREANNLFGEWCFRPGCGLVPQNRPAGRKHEVETFDTPRDSVFSYLLNLNTHDSYRAFRLERARLRKTGGGLSGVELAEQLGKYSERRDDYVKDIKHLIEVNKLADDAVAPIRRRESVNAGG